MSRQAVIALACAAAASGFVAVGPTPKTSLTSPHAWKFLFGESGGAAASKVITQDDVREAVKDWCDGIVDIGKVFSEGGDYKARALKHIEDSYAFSELPHGSKLLFKPTLANERNFRHDLEEFMSYFVGDGIFSEDGGFAIKPWSNVRFDVNGIFITDKEDTATVSGCYWFTPAEDPDTEVKVEYSFGMLRAKSTGKLKFYLHHSSLPFSG